MADSARRLLERALAEMSSSSEAKHYLKQFATQEGSRFAVVKIGGGILAEQMDDVAASLAFLFHLGLTPVVLHGAGPQLNAALESAGMSSRFDQGLRVTSDAMMAVIRPAIYRLNQQLVQALADQGVRAQGLQHGVFSARFLDQQRFGLVGEVNAVNPEGVQAIIDSGAMPIMTCLGETDSGQVLNINADIAARELVWAIRPHKIIFLTPTGGIVDQHQRLIRSISLKDQLDDLLKEPWLHSGMNLKLAQIGAMLEPLDAGTSVSITAVDQLARELFTHQGSGTLVWKGERIDQLQCPDDEQREQIRALLERSFGRRLRDDYFDTLALDRVFLSESGRAVAIITRGHQGLAYMDKFAVTPDAQGEGLGATLWKTLQAAYPAMYWRSRVNNPINPWYYRRATMTSRQQDWISFCTGADPDQAMACLIEAQARQDSWQETSA